MKDKDDKETKVEVTPFMLKTLGDGRDNRRLVQSFYKLPVVLLVDGSTMSAAEGITASLKDTGRAKVIGTKTWGKAMYFYSHNLTSGGYLTVTGGKFSGPKGVDHHGVGITPDLVKPVWREGEDLVLKAALTEIGKTKPIRVKPKTVPQVPSFKPQPQPDYWLMVGLNVCLGLAVLGVLLLAVNGLYTGSRRRSLPDFVWDPVSEQFVAGRFAVEESDEIPEVIVLDDYLVVEDVPPLLSSYELQHQNFYVGSSCCGCGKELVGGEPVVEALSYSGPSFYCDQCSVTEQLLESRLESL